MRPTAPALSFSQNSKTPLESAMVGGRRICSPLSSDHTPIAWTANPKQTLSSEAEPLSRRRSPVRRSAAFRKQEGTESASFFKKVAGALSIFGVLILLGVDLGCMPPTPAQKATDAARSMNMAARWGKMDEARGLNDPSNLSEYQKNHALWHGKIRIVETELAGLNMKDATHATIQVDVSWNFANDPTLRVTRLTQEWSDAEGSWVMVDEKFLEGDPGLFGEEVEDADKKRDRHFPSRVIH